MRVPGYRSYFESLSINTDRLAPWGILSHLPETDKKSYIDQYPLAARCLDGQIPFAGTTISIELQSGPIDDPQMADRLASCLRDGLAALDLDLDFRSACDEFPAAMLPIVTFYAMGEGPFAGDAGRIKQRRISASPPDMHPPQM